LAEIKALSDAGKDLHADIAENKSIGSFV